MRADLVAYDHNGQMTLIIEVKKKLGTSRVWAARLRRNILAHGTLPHAKFFLLALPDKFYLWKDLDWRPEIELPTFEIDSTSFLKPYFEQVGLAPEQISGQGFELIVVSWLNDLLLAKPLSTDIEQDQEWLLKSGLFEAIRGGKIEHEVNL